ncbi:MAG: hypothetical protein WHS45_11370, partial [Anaerolinea sp.]
MAKRLITAEDLYRFQVLSDPQISPDGEHVVFSVQRVDRKNEKKYTNLWVVPTRGGNAFQFTVGDHSDGHPVWSPDGNKIAFLSNRLDKEKPPALFVIPFGGGEARPLGQIEGEIGEILWSPDGRKLLLT